VAAILCNIAPAALVAVFSNDPGVIAVGTQYLRIVSWTFIASGVIFVCSSMFQALGNTMPSLAASISRVVIIAIPSIILSQMSGFELHWIWYLSVLAVVIQLSIILLLLRREFRIKLDAPLASAA
jgi:Na+-driven multidrug efflux pump